MPEPQLPQQQPDIDPDPFTIGMGVMMLLFTAGTYLEARRSSADVAAIRSALTQSTDIRATQYRNRFRTRWYRARQAVLTARELTEEYQDFIRYLDIQGYGFRFGEARLNLPRPSVKVFKDLSRRMSRATNDLATHIDNLSDFIDDRDERLVSDILEAIADGQQPHTHDAIAILALQTITLFERLLHEISSREGFGDAYDDVYPF